MLYCRKGVRKAVVKARAKRKATKKITKVHRDDSSRGIVVGMWKAGKNYCEIARSTKIPRSTVQRIVSKYRSTGGFERKPGSGRRKETTPRDDRRIARTALNDRRVSAGECPALWPYSLPF